MEKGMLFAEPFEDWQFKGERKYNIRWYQNRNGLTWPNQAEQAENTKTWCLAGKAADKLRIFLQNLHENLHICTLHAQWGHYATMDNRCITLMSNTKSTPALAGIRTPDLWCGRPERYPLQYGATRIALTVTHCRASYHNWEVKPWR